MKSILLNINFLFLILLQQGLRSSDADAGYTGRVINCETKSGVAFAQIFNESTRTGEITDSLGYFNVLAKPGDTIAVLALGYFGQVGKIPSEIHSDGFTIEICPRKYEIREVAIEIPRNYEQFQKAILEYQPEKFKIEGVPEPKIREIPLMLDTTYIKSAGFAIFHPLSFFYYNFNKREKSLRKAFYLTKEAEELPEIEIKYNREIVQRITGLNGDELTNFIGFCNFDHQFLYEATELEIIQAIEKKLSEFQNSGHAK